MRIATAMNATDDTRNLPALCANGSGARLVGIDVLRGSAALLVLFYHALAGFVLVPSDSTVWAVLVSPITLGYAGVHMFLVLSGFCIHLPMAMKSRRDQPVKLNQRTFWKRRFWRLYPAYFLAMIFGVTFGIASSMWLVNDYSVSLVLSNLYDIKWNFASHLFMLHMFSTSHMWGLNNGPLWSLALEAHLYLLYPLLLLMRSRMSLLRMLGCVLLITMAWRAFGVWVWGPMDWGGMPDKFVKVFVLSHAPARWFEWALGFAAAEVYARGVKLPAWCKSWRLALALFVSGALVRDFNLGRWLLDPLWGTSFFLLTNSVIHRERHHSRSIPSVWRPLAAVGVISYSLYLFHAPIMRGAQYLMYNFDVPRWPAVGFYVLMAFGCIALAYPLYRLFEKPFMKRGKAQGTPSKTADPSPKLTNQRIAA